jgi:hypothetical protein
LTLSFAEFRPISTLRLIVEWLSELLQREKSLRQHIAEIAAADRMRSPAPSQTDERFRRCVEPEVHAIDALLEDYLCGRTDEERSRMRYEARLSLPVYSHLRCLFPSMSSGS